MNKKELRRYFPYTRVNFWGERKLIKLEEADPITPEVLITYRSHEEHERLSWVFTNILGYRGEPYQKQEEKVSKWKAEMIYFINPENIEYWYYTPSKYYQ